MIDHSAMPDAGENYTETAEGLDLEMVWIPPGSFIMGSPESEQPSDEEKNEGPQHRVTLDGFWMGKYQVTQDQWVTVMGRNPSQFKGSWLMRMLKRSGRLPVESVQWNAAMKFCKRLSSRTGLIYTLPTEAEWEYACRAGTTTRYHFGNTITGEQANIDDSLVWGRKPIYREQTVRVGSFSANAWGLHDMHGNVWEWCADWYGENYYASSPGRNPTGPSTGVGRVLRGGSWRFPPEMCRSALRLWDDMDYSIGSEGFRVVRVITPREVAP